MEGAYLDAQSREQGTYHWRIRLRDSSVVTLVHTIVADTLRGQATLTHGRDSIAFPVLGVRIDPTFLPLRTKPVATPNPDPRPAWFCDSTMLRLRTEELVRRFHLRALPAEIAVPTAFVGRRSRLAWPEIQQWSRSGYAIVAHSRRHSAATTTDAAFIGEVLGSMQDLAHFGIRTRIFV